jgi:hypothetical protein
VSLWDIVRRALDVREANAARERAEQNYRHLLVKHLSVVKDRKRERSQAADADLLAAAARIDTLDEQFVGALSALPPPVNRDRQALARLEDENARLRDALHQAERRAVELEKQLEGNPS